MTRPGVNPPTRAPAGCIRYTPWIFRQTATSGGSLRRPFVAESAEGNSPLLVLVGFAFQPSPSRPKFHQLSGNGKAQTAALLLVARHGRAA